MIRYTTLLDPYFLPRAPYGDHRIPKSCRFYCTVAIWSVSQYRRTAHRRDGLDETVNMAKSEALLRNKSKANTQNPMVIFDSLQIIY